MRANHHQQKQSGSCCLSLVSAAFLLALLTTSFSPSSHGVQINSGEWSGSFDNTLSWGTAWRLSGPDKRIVGRTSTTLPNGTSPPGTLGGTAFSVNGDDGNLNYDTGLISNIIKLTSELELNHSSGFGLFVRSRAFYDRENEKGRREKIDLTDDAKELVGANARLLDAYIYKALDFGDKPAEIRIGDQVVSWGESTFIQNGINVINPIDVSAIRTPGAELREALLPEGMLWGSVAIDDNNSVEAFYQYDWHDTEPDPSGSYFSSNDFATVGGDRLFLGFGAVPDIVPPGAAASIATGLAPVGAVIPRGPIQRPDDGGQYGLAWRTLVPGLNDAELGFYYINYHSRLPIVSARTGTFAGLASGDYAGSAQYFTEFPEDIQMLGVSINTVAGTSGWAIQGEYSYKSDVPLQVDDVELLFAALSPLRIPEALAGAPGVGTFLATTNQVAPGGVGFNEVIHGFRRLDVSQLQATATRTFTHILKSDQLAVAAEIGFTHVHNMPDKSTLRFEVPGTFTSGNLFHTFAGVQPGTEPISSFADRTSAGYQVRGRLDYNNAVGDWTLSPVFAFRHDISGNTPGPGGNFLEGRKAITLGLNANLKNQWTMGVSYTNFFGAGKLNLLNDRDFLSFNIKYSK